MDGPYEDIDKLLVEEIRALGFDEDDEFLSYEALDASGAPEMCDECGTELDAVDDYHGVCPHCNRHQKFRRPIEESL